MTAPRRPILAVTGLRAEARVAAGDGIVSLAGGGDPAGLARALESRIGEGVAAVISFGIAGGLAPGLPPGTVVVADAVVDGDRRWRVDPAWCTALRIAIPSAKSGLVCGVDAPVAGQDAKVRLSSRTGAVVVDMESHIAARLADRSRLPFAVLRVVADPAERTVPAAALVGMRGDGTTDVGAVVRALARRPGELPGLIRTAVDAGAAFRALRAARTRAGHRLGFDPRPAS